MIQQTWILLGSRCSETSCFSLVCIGRGQPDSFRAQLPFIGIRAPCYSFKSQHFLSTDTENAQQLNLSQVLECLMNAKSFHAHLLSPYCQIKVFRSHVGVSQSREEQKEKKVFFHFYFYFLLLLLLSIRNFSFLHRNEKRTKLSIL